MNNDVWNGLSDAEQAFFREQAQDLEDRMWEATAAEDARGMNCNTSGPCETEIGGMTEVTLSDEAAEELRTKVEDGVVAPFAARCNEVSPDCGARWGETIGALLGYDAG